jgi:adenylate cyclase class 2
MNREIEWQFQVQPDQLDDLRRMLLTLGAEREGEYLMPIIVYSNPMKPDIYIRIRHEGKHVSYTVKTDLKAEFPIEREVEVEPTQKNIDELNAMLLLMGNTVKYRVEKIREVWRMRGIKEIVFDSYPGVPTFMEIDALTESALHRVADDLGLLEENRLRNKDVYNHFYGMPSNRVIPPGNELRFEPNAKQQFAGLFGKDESEFDRILAKQIEYLQKL